MLKDCIESYLETGQTTEAFHFDDFEIRDRKLYYRDKSTSVTIKGGKLRLVDDIADILIKEGLRDLGFDIPMSKFKARQAIMLNRVEEDLPSMSDIAKVDDIELQEIIENASRSTENLIAQIEGESSEDMPMCELIGLDKQLRSSWGLLKVDIVRKVELQQRKA